MDLQTAVAASMLPTDRIAVAVAFKELSRTVSGGPAFLEFLWSAAGRSAVLGSHAIHALLDDAGRTIEAGARLGVEPVALFDERYPRLLEYICSPPPVLWLRGDRVHLEHRIVAVVGSRAASSYALEVADKLGTQLAERGIVVASGLARGVDSAAHRGALKAGGPTIAVQGCGLDRVYPAEHSDLADEVAANGLLLSELGPGAPPLPVHFPLRNRIISGISLATVVVEASEKSGSLITARWALEQGRDVMAVPGSILSGRNRGSHALLKDGAKVVETADDILQELGWSAGSLSTRSSNSLNSEPLLGFMDPGEPYQLDRLVALSGLDGPKVLAVLTELELKEMVVSSNGTFVRRA